MFQIIFYSPASRHPAAVKIENPTVDVALILYIFCANQINYHIYTGECSEAFMFVLIHTCSVVTRAANRCMVLLTSLHVCLCVFLF